MTQTESKVGDNEADLLRATERQRLRALVEVNIAFANQLHADDFQLIPPSGRPLSKEEYLGAVASGVINYTCLGTR